MRGGVAAAGAPAVVGWVAGPLASGEAGDTGGPAVTGVTVMPMTAPFTLFFWVVPIVWRAARVAAALTTAWDFAATVLVPVDFGGLKPKSSRMPTAAAPKVPSR